MLLIAHRRFFTAFWCSCLTSDGQSSGPSLKALSRWSSKDSYSSYTSLFLCALMTRSETTIDTANTQKSTIMVTYALGCSSKVFSS